MKFPVIWGLTNCIFPLLSLLQDLLQWVDRSDLALAQDQPSMAHPGAWAHQGGVGASQTEAGGTQTGAWGPGGHGGEAAEEEVSTAGRHISCYRDYPNKNANRTFGINNFQNYELI